MIDVFNIEIGGKEYRLKPSIEKMIAYEDNVMPIAELVSRIPSFKFSSQDIANLVLTFWLDKPDNANLKDLQAEIRVNVLMDGVVLVLGKLDGLLGAICAGPKKSNLGALQPQMEQHLENTAE